ncbi:MAG: GTP cyclohydrolase, FolE2/MptA family [Geobacteraceae bacterium]|nr:GTP cyclohydrolase, FolE2/MptA family [Geobacteraceae bacterium]
MKDEKRFMQDVGMTDLPFPMKVLSREHKDGQFTIAKISIAARIMHEFEASWIDKFIQIVHQHREKIGTESLKSNILDYMRELNATKVKVDFEYPFFVEKSTPVSNEKCLVRYNCMYSAKVAKSDLKPQVSLKIAAPCITTYPGSSADKPGGLFGQMSRVDLEVQSHKDIYPEDLIDIIDNHALVQVYSFLTEEDQAFIIKKVHSEQKTSVVMVDEIKEDLANIRDIEGYSVSCANFGMLHSYSTFIGTAKSMWIPLS